MHGYGVSNQTSTRSEAWGVYGYDPSSDFRSFAPDYRDRINRYKDEIEKLRHEVYDQAKRGRKTKACRQILVEAHWLTQYTADFVKIEKRIADLKEMLAKPADPSDADKQSPDDGSFNRYAQEWFYKVDSACDKLVVMQFMETKPAYPLRFLDRINSPEKLRSYLDSRLISDVRKTGVDTRFELNLCGSDLVRLITGSLPSGYQFHPKLKDVMLDYLDNRWQDPKTGFWGCWYQTPSGIRKTADMSNTFHIVHYREGQVKHWPEIIKTLLAMRNLEWPYGWLQEGRMSDHHNYDIAALFHYGWASMSKDQRVIASREIERMMAFCLKESLRPDGSFNLNDELTIGESFQFPVLFLYEIGYFNKENRFWTKREFPEAKAVADRIAKKIKELKLDDPESQTALLILQHPD